jgi:hypothetical protein
VKELKQIDPHTKVLVDVPDPEPPKRGPKPKVKDDDDEHPEKSL